MCLFLQLYIQRFWTTNWLICFTTRLSNIFESILAQSIYQMSTLAIGIETSNPQSNNFIELISISQTKYYFRCKNSNNFQLRSFRNVETIFRIYWLRMEPDFFRVSKVVAKGDRNQILFNSIFWRKAAQTTS